MATRIGPALDNGARLMITDGGDHDLEAWAVVTAEHLCPINPTMTGSRQIAARRLQTDIAEALLPHHTKVRGAETDGLAVKGDAHFDALPDPAQYIDEAIAAIQKAAAATPWGEHYTLPPVVDIMRNELGSHFATVQHNARSWHADTHPDHPKAQAWAAVRRTPPAAA